MLTYSAGISGNTKVVEVGGPGYLLPLANLSRIYDLKDIAAFTKTPDAFIIGATSGPFPYVGVNCEVSHFFLVKRRFVFVLFDKLFRKL